jgi:hypothetical protein
MNERGVVTGSTVPTPAQLSERPPQPQRTAGVLQSLALSHSLALYLELPAIGIYFLNIINRPLKHRLIEDHKNYFKKLQDIF